MNIDILQHFFDAIKNNDIATFSEIVNAKRSMLSIRFGRFPLLSVCYLFRSTNIISEYERDLSGIVNYNEVEELRDIYVEFKSHAKKCMRFYLEEGSIVYPLEMLAIINDAYTLRNVYAKYAKTELTKSRLSDIYRILHNQNIKQEDNIIYIKKQKLPKKQAIIIVAMVLLVVIITGMFGGLYTYANAYYGKGTEENPIIIRRGAQLKTAFTIGKSYYMLANDIVLSEDFNTDFDGILDGKGHTLAINYNIDKPILGIQKGTISNLNVSINDQSYDLVDDFAFITNKNEGSLINVSVNVKAELSEATDKEDLYASIICVENSGSIVGCKVSANITYTGNGVGNAYLSAFAAKNTGIINRCTLSEESSFDTDTVDIGGIVAENVASGKINNSKNYALIKQTTLSADWNPNCAGIAMLNYGVISDCLNAGAIEASSQADNSSCVIYVGGIVAINNSKISKSKNKGELTVNSKVCEVYLGGIAAINYTVSSVVESSGEDSIMSVESPSESALMFVGGIVARNDGTIKDCFFVGEMQSTNIKVLHCYIVGVATNLSFSNNIALKRESVPYWVLFINFNTLLIYDEDRLTFDTMEEVKMNEVYWE